MRRLLTSRAYSFDPKNVHVLSNEQATRDNILKREIDGFLVKNAGPGDIIVFHFSGHGSLMGNPADPSSYDNTIVPYDSRDPNNRSTDSTKNVWDIRDKELNVRLRQMSER